MCNLQKNALLNKETEGIGEEKGWNHASGAKKKTKTGTPG